MPSLHSKWFLKKGEPRRVALGGTGNGDVEGSPLEAIFLPAACLPSATSCLWGQPGLQCPANAQGDSWRHLHYCLDQQDTGGLSAGLR